VAEGEGQEAMRYLVTGGCGFIGSHTADELLAAGHKVRILDNLSTGTLRNKPATAELIVGDVADFTVVKEAMKDTDGVFHFAAVSSVELCNRNWVEAHRTNMTGTITVFAAARSAKNGRAIPVVYASSAAVYGRSADPPLRESARTCPESPYGADKLGCELHAVTAFPIHGLPTCGLRFFNVYGPRQDPRSPYSGVISIFCRLACSNEPITIFGDGRQTRDFVFVRDVVRGVIAAMARCGSGAEVVNICTGRGTSLLELVAIIEQKLGARTSVRFAERRPGDIDVSIGDPSHAETRFGFRAQTSLRVGLSSLLFRATAGRPGPLKKASSHEEGTPLGRSRCPSSVPQQLGASSCACDIGENLSRRSAALAPCVSVRS
jgi:UDP-glucose 4-epimerase